MDFKTTTHTCTCGRCGAIFTVESASGPSELCDKCALPLFQTLGLR